MFNKKRAEISLNVIIVAAICLLVLIVLLFIFSDRIGAFALGVKSCTSQSGVCKTSCDAGEPIVQKTDCDRTNKVCCVKLTGT